MVREHENVSEMQRSVNTSIQLSEKCMHVCLCVTLCAIFFLFRVLQLSIHILFGASSWTSTAIVSLCIKYLRELSPLCSTDKSTLIVITNICSGAHIYPSVHCFGRWCRSRETKLKNWKLSENWVQNRTGHTLTHTISHICPVSSIRIVQCFAFRKSKTYFLWFRNFFVYCVQCVAAKVVIFASVFVLRVSSCCRLSSLSSIGIAFWVCLSVFPPV